MIKKLFSQLLKQSSSFALAVLCLSLIVNSQSTQEKKISENNLTDETYLRQQESEGLKLSFLKKMSAFGFDNLIADWTMLQFLQYFGDSEARDITGYSLSADYLEVITKNDPLFSRAYMVISPASSMFAGTPERTVELMNRGLAKMSPDITDAYYVWLYKGVDEILFLGDLQEAKKSYQISANWASKAGNEQIAESASGTVEFLATKPDVRQAQVGTWFLVWNNTKDERIRQLAETKIESVGGELKIDPDGIVKAIPPKIDKS
ncbi:MAG: hypothetical protein AAGF83_19125 [Cyanobacteria bacterium P01_G01_bin.67]